MDWLAGIKNLIILYVKILALVRLSTEYKLISCIFLSSMINSETYNSKCIEIKCLNYVSYIIYTSLFTQPEK